MKKSTPWATAQAEYETRIRIEKEPAFAAMIQRLEKECQGGA